MPLLVAFAAEGANAPLYFIGPPANYVTYNPYRWNEIEIKEFRGQDEKPVADWIKQARYPLIREGGPNGEKNPYVEVDVNGSEVTVKGPMGSLSRVFHRSMKVSLEDMDEIRDLSGTIY